MKKKIAMILSLVLAASSAPLTAYANQLTAIPAHAISSMKKIAPTKERFFDNSFSIKAS
ncbi:MAG: hypothetical protein IJY06_04510 [Oscillospiraceae bacterium]|nr:hypothetical protein [Oscillospiraceae bacterium]